MSNNNNEEKKQITEAPIKVNGEVPKEQLNEITLSWAGKLFFAGAAAYIMGRAAQKMHLPIKVRGTPEQMQAVIDAIVGSKEFQEEITKPGATIDSVIDKLRIRNISKQRFYQLTGIPWPL